MNLRLKLLLPLLVISAFLLGISHILILPAYFQERENELVDIFNIKIQLLSESIANSVAREDENEIEELVYHLKEKDDHWKKITIKTADGLLLFPKDSLKKILPTYSQVRHAIVKNDIYLGEINAYFDLNPTLQKIESKAFKIELLIYLILGIIIFVTWKWQERVIFKPIESLLLAAKNMNSGHFDSPVESESNEKIGELITQFEILRQSFHESQEKFQALFEHSVDAQLLIDKNIKIIECNPQAVRVLQRSRKDILKTPVIEFFSKQDSNFKLLLSLLSGSDSAVIEQGSEPFQLPCVTSDETELSTEVTIKIVEYHQQWVYLLALHDLSERQKSEEMLKISQERLRLGLENTNTGLWDWNVDTGYTYFSTQWQKMLGYNKAEFPPTISSWQTLIHPDDLKDTMEVFMRHLKGDAKKFVSKHRLRCKNSDWLWVKAEGGITHRDADGVPTRVVGTLVDITKRIIYEQFLLDARKEAEDGARAKSEFLANMSHEIRTPMNGILGMIHLLTSTELTAKQQEYISVANSSAESLLTIINDILDLSKIEAGRLELENIEFDLPKLIEDISCLMQQPARGSSLELISAIDKTLPSHFRGDPTRLRQVLTNLLSNAIKFTHVGEVILRVINLSETDSFSEGQAVKLRIEVQDTGIGISPEAQEKLFDSFSQADGSTTRKYGGTGLGLSISRKIVEIMGGQIGVESALGDGSTFFIELDLPYVSDHLPRAELPGNLRILVVEDNATTRIILTEYLEMWGAKVEAVDSAVNALAKLKYMEDQPDYYDVALLDMQMPEMDGLQLASVIRNNKIFDNLNLVLLTSMGGDDIGDAQACLDLIMHKPLRMSLLYENLSQLVGREIVDQSEPVSNHFSESKNEMSVACATDELRGMNILLVEDNEINQIVAQEMLRTMCANIDVAENGLEGLNAYQVNPLYDLILMDCQMPVLDGFEATKKIRQWELENALDRVPIIALTANALQEDKKRCFGVGMDDYLAKPFDPESLLNIVEKWRTNNANNDEKTGVKSSSVDETNTAQTSVEELSTNIADIDLNKVKVLKDMLGVGYKGLVEAYVRSADHRLGDLEKCIQEKDSTKAAAILHGLKGSSANIGALRVAKSCEVMESKVANDEFLITQDDLNTLIENNSNAIKHLQQS